MLKITLRWVLALFMMLAGILHFVGPEGFVKIVPDYLPWPLALVYISGFFEILGGVGLLVPRLRVAAAWGLVALFLAVFPANIHQAIHHIPFGASPTPTGLLWLRVAFQFVFIRWAWSYTRS